ncbi:GNAT family N-acetyltransferase [Sorangium cellulosum]|uniref:GNAT family N-acetyltransferase n=1 Tax=Sorangium TaxID=39643 RepID=UPI0009D66235|nr:GNAT family N-acetyltransferase [Sorangium cellulosum]
MRKAPSSSPGTGEESLIYVRRIHRRDLNRVWEFLKKVFRDVNRETVEYQRPRSKKRFLEVYEEEGVEQLLFEVRQGEVQEIVGYAECAFEITGTDNWMNERYFTKHDMRPLFVEELAVHPDYQGRGVGAFMLEQLEHLARIHGCTHLVLEVAENNIGALKFYRKRSFSRLDAAIFMAKKVAVDSELLPPRALKKPRPPEELGAPAKPKRSSRRATKGRGADKRSGAPPSQPPESSRPDAPAGGTCEPPAKAGPTATRPSRPGPERDRGASS